jgi:hypothetical protein
MKENQEQVEIAGQSEKYLEKIGVKTRRQVDHEESLKRIKQKKQFARFLLKRLAVIIGLMIALAVITEFRAQ